VWVRCRPIGVFWIRTGDRREAKLVCVPQGEPGYDKITDLSELAEYQRNELGNFFDVYRSLDEHSDAVSEGSEDAEAAVRVLAQARARAG
jgi:inorganic pyrophosphatase